MYDIEIKFDMIWYDIYDCVMLKTVIDKISKEGGVWEFSVYRVPRWKGWDKNKKGGVQTPLHSVETVKKQLTTHRIMIRAWITLCFVPEVKFLKCHNFVFKINVQAFFLISHNILLQWPFWGFENILAPFSFNPNLPNPFWWCSVTTLSQSHLWKLT